MYSVEKEITQKSIDQANNHQGFAHLYENENRLKVIRPEAFDQFASRGAPIHDIYLSHPDDESSLRVRKQIQSHDTLLSGTSKSRGEVKNNIQSRIEVPAQHLSPDSYDYYQQRQQFPTLNQLRTHITDEMSIDFIKGFPHPLIEIETDDPVRRNELMKDLEGLVEDVTSDRRFNKESIAHSMARHEFMRSTETLEAFSNRVISEMIALYAAGKNQVVVGLTGMSGSGKTTVTKMIQEKIVDLFSEEFSPTILSTDDYHFGKTHLDAINKSPWTAWDDPRTYNTLELARDLDLTRSGHTLIRRHFDFDTEEPVFDTEIRTSPFIIIEGLYAGSEDLRNVRDLHFELPTSIATSVGRDLRRLIVENRVNRAFPNPESRLKYQLETAIPLYLDQERPSRNSFNASMRIMADRAFMFERLHALDQ